MWRGLIEAYREYLPVSEKTPIISLNEGNTPLIPSVRLFKHFPKPFKLYFKYEGLNPTGSFKDRGMCMAISKAKESGSQAVICASTGNTSASAAAYAARAGMKSVVLIPDGNIALGKLSQAMMHGAKVLAVSGNFDLCLKRVREIAEEYPLTLVNSVNPFRLEGQKTGAFEIVDALGVAPDFHFIPVGNAGNIAAYWKGYQEYYAHQKINFLPKMMGYQAAGAAPLVKNTIIENPQTLATAIRIGNPASRELALQAVAESKGQIDSVTDDEIINAYKLLSAEEGIFCEPASAASVAGLLKYKDQIPEGSTVVCVLTGHGLKDPNQAIDQSASPTQVSSEKEAILKALGV